VVFVSSILFTVVFAWAIPIFFADASTWPQKAFQETDSLRVSNYLAPIGFSSLSLILIGLIVSWTEYLKGSRWAWFVMFVIVWGWAFPVMVLPILQRSHGISLGEWFHTAVREPSPYRDLAAEVLMFSLLLIALILPVKVFFGRKLTT
jgi:hypothetical protein